MHQKIASAVLAEVLKHAEIGLPLLEARARVVTRREGEMDAMTVLVETDATDTTTYEKSVLDILKLRVLIELVARGFLPNDGQVIEDQLIEDQRKYD